MTKIVADPRSQSGAESGAEPAANSGAESPADSSFHPRTERKAGEALSDLVILICTFPKPEDLGEIALTLVGENLCACVNILHESLSIYRWNDEIVTNKEVLCLIKTTRARHAALVARLSELHPYEVPEIITLNSSAVNEPYLRWVNTMTTGSSRLVSARDEDDERDR